MILSLKHDKHYSTVDWEKLKQGTRTVPDTFIHCRITLRLTFSRYFTISDFGLICFRRTESKSRHQLLVTEQYMESIYNIMHYDNVNSLRKQEKHSIFWCKLPKTIKFSILLLIAL